MLKLSGCLAAAALSLVALAPSTASAQTCGAIAGAALSIVEEGLLTGNGAPFFTSAFRFAYELNVSDVRDIWGYGSPSSPIYYDYILDGVNFTNISTLVDTNSDGLADNVAPGDIVVIDEATAPVYSGHTVVIVGDVKKLATPQGPINSFDQWIVAIADQTGSSHGCATIGGVAYNDSRGCGTITAAPGTAYIRLYTDPTTGVIEGYNWKAGPSNASYYTQAQRGVTIGRVAPCPPAFSVITGS
ncbi:hypothetical protein [Chondromyces apiculatus]|uniref:Peptidase C51 domain-containing protein n=1 Tax=Chondromyces apiculatus DSM 436 TaxID=1192034 RepID=A0A017SWR6_9BACT|nr:hypothetical protein [Chondromyces apiculatus]EYF01207.1 Hypothetical protein CAP_8548 [Chondromyces apiculatus DSM 436]